VEFEPGFESRTYLFDDFQIRIIAPMATSDTFYSGIPVFRGFASLMDPALYSPLPDDWSIGIADNRPRRSRSSATRRSTWPALR
jgi:hypothetical protein